MTGPRHTDPAVQAATDAYNALLQRVVEHIGASPDPEDEAKLVKHTAESERLRAEMAQASQRIVDAVVGRPQ